MRLTSIGVTVSLVLYGIAALILWIVSKSSPQTSWLSLLSLIVTLTFIVVLLWVPATALMIVSAILGYPYNLYAGAASLTIGLAHIALVIWVLYESHDMMISWLLFSLVGISVGVLLCYLGLRLIGAYRKKKLVEFEPLLTYLG